MDRSRPLTARARQLRRNETPAEKILRRCLRARRFLGLKFRRQHPVGPYIPDFSSPEVMLLIELDGPGHLETVSEDAIRDQFLRDLGWRVLRFKNEEVELRLHAVLETIVHEIYKVYPLPDPLPRGEREAMAALVWVATWAMRD